MAKKDIKFTLDTIDSRYSPVGTVKQLDSVFFHIKITENGVTKDLTGQTIKLFAIKEDKKIVEQTTKINITNQREGLVEIELLNAAIQVHGFTYFELEISDSNGIISTADFILRVNKRVGSDEAIESTNEVSTLKKVEAYVAKAKVELEEFKKIQSEILATNGEINTQESLRVEAETKRMQSEEARVESDKLRDKKITEFGKKVEKLEDDIANFTIKDNSIGKKNFKQNSVDLNSLSKDLMHSECYTVNGGTGSKEFIFTGIPTAKKNDNKIKFMIYSDISTDLTIIIFANNTGVNSQFENEQFRKTISLKEGYNYIEQALDRTIDASFSNYIIYMQTSFNNTSLYFRKKDFYIDGIQIKKLEKRSEGVEVFNEGNIPWYLINSKNIKKELDNNIENLTEKLEEYYSNPNKSFFIDYKSQGINTTVFTFRKSDLENSIEANGEFKIIIKYKENDNINFEKIQLWYANSLDGGYTANDGGCEVLKNIVKDGYRIIEVASSNSYDINKDLFIKPFLTFNITNVCKLDIKISFLFNNKNMVEHIIKKENYQGEHKIEEKYSEKFLINKKELNKLSDELLSIILSSISINRWKGKNYLAIGDSITYANGNTSVEDKLLVGYQRKVADRLGMELETFAVGGMDLTNGLRGYFESGYMDNIIRNKDLITIFMGTNDFGANNDLGELIKSNSISFEKTFTGSYQFLLKKIFTINPTVTVILLTPAQRASGEDSNEKYLKLANYVDAVKKIAQANSCYCFDLHGEVGINLNNIDNFTYDGLHPNQKGHDLIGEYIANKLLIL